ncbi:MAG: metal-dependent hydrolase [Halolamina sp.]|uniref:metal-dependent hydrolase n=1 Tax=Halolamina sp. TaxID=1940283 RepID=UPI002FC397FB
MPSTLVHVAIGGLVGAALLGDRFTPRAIAVVLVAAAIPDLDSVLTTFVGGAHRSALHTLLLPTVLAAGLYWDNQVSDRSWLGERFGPDAGYVAAVAVVGLAAGGILPDLFTNGVNAFWPLHDQFYTVNGELLLSDQRGIVQTFVDLSPEKPASTTDNTRYSTGADPKPWTEQEGPVERTFPVVTAGWQLMVVLLSTVSVGVRTWQVRRSDSLNSRR